MALEGSINPGDLVYEPHGVKLILDPYTDAVSGHIYIDYVDGGARGFRIYSQRRPPNAC